jgi:hypothetical protein
MPVDGFHNRFYEMRLAMGRALSMQTCLVKAGIGSESRTNPDNALHPHQGCDASGSMMIDLAIPAEPLVRPDGSDRWRSGSPARRPGRTGFPPRSPGRVGLGGLM